MQILILSDSHLRNENVFSILNHHPNIKTIIHCGDVGKEIQFDPSYQVYLVKGNNDFLDYPLEIETKIDQKRFFITHGHLYQVDFNYEQLEKKAKENQIDVVCFGHTHDPICYQKENILFINPGSVSFPRGNHVFVPTYCILNENQVHFYHAKTFENIDHVVYQQKSEKTSFLKRLLQKKANTHK